MSAISVLWIGLFWAMQVIAHLLFKWGSGSDTRWLFGFFGGHFFGVTSIWFMMLLYKVMNPNVAMGICMGGSFLLAQLALAIVFRSGISAVQYAGIAAIALGMILLAAARSSTS